jgi:8-oxo-dGTP pyrophosphatase MutT (NUDIX family)
VLVPVFRDPQDDLRLVLVKRGARGVHGGQLGLPGGKQEQGDASLLETAVREAGEELGLERRDVEVLAELTPVDSHTTGFRVYRFVARVKAPGYRALARGEIAGVVTPELRVFADRAARRYEFMSFPAWPKPRRVESVALEGGERVWGLTLRLLDDVAPRLLAGEWAV